MTYSVKNLEHSQIEINFELPFGELEKFKNKAVLNLGKELKVEGFRQGHVPKEIIEQKLGHMVILEEAAELAIAESYREAIDNLSREKNIVPIDRPRVEILKLAPDNPLQFRVLVFVLPEVELPDYKKIASEFSRKESNVTEKDIDDSLNWLQKSRAKFSLKNDASIKGDFLEIEYSSGQIDDGKKYQDAFILGEGRFAAGFEENLEGLKDSQEKEFSVNFPQDYPQKNLAGQKIDFSVKVKSVQKMELPQMDDDFAKILGSFQDLAALKKNIKEGLKEEKEREESGRLRTEILEKIIDGAKCEIPEVLVASEKNIILEDLKHRVSHNLKITFEEYLAGIKKSEKDLLDSFTEQAQKRAKSKLILKAISDKENILPSQEEIDEEISNFLKAYPDIKAAGKEFDRERLKEYTKEAVCNEKTFKLLESFVK